MIYHVLQSSSTKAVFLDFLRYRLGETKKYTKGLDNQMTIDEPVAKNIPRKRYKLIDICVKCFKISIYKWIEMSRNWARQSTLYKA